MPTYYVTTTGNDTTGNGSQALPWLTLQKAENSASDGDTVNVGAGTFQAATYTTFAKQIDWEGQGIGLTTIRGNNGARIMYLNSNKTKSFSGFTIDGDSSGSEPTYHFEGSAVDQLTTFSDCHFINGNLTTARINSGMRGVAMTNCIFDIENEDQLLALVGGDTGFSMTGCTINVPTGITMNGVIYQSGTVTSALIRITNNTFNVLPNYVPIRLVAGGIDDLEITGNTLNIASNNTRSVIELKDIEGECLVSGNIVESEATSSAMESMRMTSTLVTGPSCTYTIEDNVMNMKKADGYGILIGDEGGDIISKAGAFNGSVIQRNVMRAAPYYGLPIGSIHGVMMGGNINFFFRENYFYGVAYGAACKGQGEAWTDGYIRNNIFVNCQYPVRHKGQKDIRTANNVFVGDNGDSDQCMAISDNGVGATSTGSFTRNNVYQISSGYAIYTQDTSHIGMSHDYNCFYLTGTAKAGYINGVEYDTLEDLQAAGYDLNSISGNPNLKADYTIDASSVCYQKGVPIEGVTDIVDVGGNNNIVLTGNAVFSMDSPYKNRVPIT